MDAQSTRVTIEAFGARLALEVDDPALIETLTPRLPPGWTRSAEDANAARFAIFSADGLHYEVTHDEQTLGHPAELDIAVAVLESAIRVEVAQRAAGVVFIHAGAVALDDRALLLPGRSFAGKTTLVHELIRQGATYYSDEYALIDGDGRVRPYPKLLSVRAPGAVRSPLPAPSTETDPRTLGARVGRLPIPIGLIAATAYHPGAEWSPRELTSAEGALMLLSHAVTLRAQPDRVIELVSAATAGSRALEGDRGEAVDTAEQLLALLARQPERAGCAPSRGVRGSDGT